MEVTIYGSGYVGLVTGACLAQVGNDVLCVDINSHKIDMLKRGEIPMYEPGLTAMIAANQATGRLRFSLDMAEGVDHGLYQLIAVGTPPNEDGSADLSHVLTVARNIGRHLTDYRLIVNKSTVPVGTADRVRAVIAEALAARNTDCEFDVVSNPEFLKEGAAIDDFMRPDRIVIGTDNSKTTELLRTLYAPFNRNRDRLITMDVRSAELTKYAANAMLATKISFMNELSRIAERLGANIEHVRTGMGADSRIGYSFIYPGAGYGGSCFPKDVQALARTARDVGCKAELLEAVEAVNYRQKRVLFEKIQSEFGADLRGHTFALWGLAFKPNTDDMRAASSRMLMEQLWEAGAHVQAYDPVAMDEARRIYGERDDLRLCVDSQTTLQGADALIVITEWAAFRSPDFEQIRSTLKQPVIFDGRNLYDPSLLADLGIRHYSIGRQSPPPTAP